MRSGQIVLAHNLTSATRAKLRRANVTLVDAPMVAAPPLLARSRHVGTWHKLALWGLERDGYTRVLSLDADVIVRRNVDHLLADAAIAPPAATAEGVPPARDGSVLPFNTGVLLLRPSSAELAKMLRAKDSLPSYDGSERTREDTTRDRIASAHRCTGVVVYDA